MNKVRFCLFWMVIIVVTWWVYLAYGSEAKCTRWCNEADICICLELEDFKGGMYYDPEREIEDLRLAVRYLQDELDVTLDHLAICENGGDYNPKGGGE